MQLWLIYGCQRTHNSENNKMRIETIQTHSKTHTRILNFRNYNVC